MTTELTYLVLSALLCVLLWVPYVLARFAVWGIFNTLGYPENPPALPAWAARAQAAHTNMVENLAPFAAVVAAAALAKVSDPVTGLGAALFFYGRLAHAPVYILKIPVLRTVAFLVAWAGILLIGLRALGAI